MRITHVVGRYHPSMGGVEITVIHLAQGMAKLGHDVEVVTVQHDPGLPLIEEHEGVTIRRFAPAFRSYDYAIAPKMFRALADTSYPVLGKPGARESSHVVHGHSYHTVVPLAAKRAKADAFVFSPYYHGTGHTFWRSALHRPYHLLGRGIFGAADAVACLSRTEAEIVERDFPGTAEKITVISNGVDEAMAHSSPFCGATENGNVVILACGRLVPYKQFERVVEAMAFLPARYRLVITGEGPSRASIEARINSLGVADRVTLAGYTPRQDLLRWMRTAKVVVSMSEQESQGLVLLEAVGAGAMAVASDIPAHKDVARETSGPIRLVPTHAGGGELANAIKAQIDSPHTNGIVPLWSEVVDKMLGLYDSAIALGSGVYTRVSSTPAPKVKI